MEQTLGSSVEDDVLAEAAAKLQAGSMDGGPDWGQVVGARQRSSTEGDVAVSRPNSEHRGSVIMATDEPGTGEIPLPPRPLSPPADCPASFRLLIGGLAGRFEVSSRLLWTDREGGPADPPPFRGCRPPTRDDWLGAAASASLSESESAPAGDAITPNAVLLRVPARREAMLRDMLAFSSDGECMDGPQVRALSPHPALLLPRVRGGGGSACLFRSAYVPV